MVRLSSTAPINIECERSINDEQAKFVKSNVKRIKAFEKEFNVYTTIAKNEMGTLILKVGRSTEKCDAKVIEEEMEKIMDRLILMIERDSSDEEEKKERFIHLTVSEDGCCCLEGNMNPLIAIEIMIAALREGEIKLEDCQCDETDPE